MKAQHPREAPKPSTSLPPCTRGGCGARVLRRLQHLQNTPLFSENRQNRATFLSCWSPATLCAPGNRDLEPEEGRTSCENNLDRTEGSLHASPYSFPSTAHPASHPHRGRTAFPHHLANRSQLQSRRREKVTPIHSPKRSFHGIKCFKNQHPKRHETVFFKCCKSSSLAD